MMKTKQCFICAATYNDNQYSYWSMEEIRDCYRVFEYKDVCQKCATKANRFVSYFEVKKEKDKKALKEFLMSGILIKNRYQALAEGGYYEAYKSFNIYD